MVVPAVGHVDAGGADGHPDALGLVVDGDGAKVGVEFAFPHLLGADQLPVNGQTFDRGALTTHQICGNVLKEPCTCSAVRNQVEDVARFGVDVEADVHVASGQVDDEVRVVIHWRRNVMFKNRNKQLGCCFYANVTDGDPLWQGPFLWALLGLARGCWGGHLDPRWRLVNHADRGRPRN